MPTAFNGRNFTLNTYSTMSTPSSRSWDHWVVSRKKTRISLSTSSRRWMPIGREHRLADSPHDGLALGGAAAALTRTFLGFGEPLREARAVQQSADDGGHDGRAQRAAYGHGDRSCVSHPDHRMSGPLAWQPRRRRRLQRGEIARERLESLGARQALRTEQA